MSKLFIQKGYMALAMGLSLAATAYGDYYSSSSAYSNSAPTTYRSGEMTATSASDQEILKKIQDKIGPGWFTQGYDQVKAQVNNGVVTLRGAVKTWKDKEKVENEVRNIHGVRTLNSQISVEEPSSNQPYTYRDTQSYPSTQSSSSTPYQQSMTYRDSQSYQQSNQYQPYPQSTTTYKDTQTYSSNGYKNQTYAYRDSQAADFPNDNFATASDEQLNKRIRDNVSRGWLWNNYKDVSLNTQNGLVTLEGTVDDMNDQQKLIMEIQKIDGVKGVRSNLRINNR